MIEQVFAALSRSSASGSKKTALAPFQWLLGLVLSALLVADQTDSENGPVVILLLWFTGITFSVTCLAALYLLFKRPDFLRSERFSIEKLMIERGLVGDTASGFSQVENQPVRLVTAGDDETDS